MTNTAKSLLAAAPPASSWFRSLLTDAIAIGLRVTSWAKGSPTRAIYYGVSRSLETLGGMVSAIANQGFRSTATGDALTLNVQEVSGITRPGASYATTTVLISNSGGGNYPFAARELVLLNTTKQAQYQNLSAVTIGPLAVDVEVEVIAVEAGSNSTALPGEIDDFVTSVDGLTINQPTAAIAVDAMSDADLQAAAAARVGFVPTASTIGAGGAPGAYESVVRAGPDGLGGVLRADGTRISVTRVAVLDDGSGGVRVIVADEDGPIEVSDLALVNAAVIAYSTPVAVTAAVENAGTESIAATFAIAIADSSTALDADIETAAVAEILAYFQSSPIGGYTVLGVPMIPLDGMENAVRRGVEGIDVPVVKVAFSVPSGDVTTIADDEVPILSGTPTITISRVPGI